MARYFTVEEAEALLPEARRRIGEVAALTAELQTVVRALNTGAGGDAGGVPEAKALEARVHEGLEWFAREGIQVKGVAPALLDFPFRLGGRDLLLCWLQGEDRIAWYHPVDTGFLGRAPISELDVP